MGDDLTEDDETELSFNEGDVNSNVNNDDSETITVIVDGDISHRSNSKPKTNTCPNAPDNDTDSQDSRAGDVCDDCFYPVFFFFFLILYFKINNYTNRNVPSALKLK